MLSRNWITNSLLLLPVIYCLFMANIGIEYGAKSHRFDLNEYFLNAWGEKTHLEFSLPYTDEKSVVYSYSRPKTCYYVSPKTGRTSCYAYDKIYSYEELKGLINQLKNSVQKREYLGVIHQYEFVKSVEKINNAVPWDWFSIIGICIAIAYLRKKKALKVLGFWWWYSLWGFLSCLGFYAAWRNDFSSFETSLDGILMPIVTHHYLNSIFVHAHFILFLVLVPLIFLSNWFVLRMKPVFSGAVNEGKQNQTVKKESESHV